MGLINKYTLGSRRPSLAIPVLHYTILPTFIMIIDKPHTSHEIRAAAQRHTDLLAGIDELDFAPPALAQCEIYVKELEQQKKTSDEMLLRLVKHTAQERREALELKESIVRKWSQKLMGQGKKYKESLSKEERCVES
jgi:hypothetical protein